MRLEGYPSGRNGELIEKVAKFAVRILGTGVDALQRWGSHGMDQQDTAPNPTPPVAPVIIDAPLPDPKPEEDQ